MSDLLVIAGIFAAWVLLQRFILPSFGVPT